MLPLFVAAATDYVLFFVGIFVATVYTRRMPRSVVNNTGARFSKGVNMDDSSVQKSIRNQ